MKRQIKTVIQMGVIASGLMLAAGQGALAACVTNATVQTLLFTIDVANSTERAVQTLAPYQSLCLPETLDAVLHVYASETELEGCSRLVGPAGQDTLLVFARYDNCSWASQQE